MSITQQVEVLRHIEEISKGAARGVHVECKGVDECTIRFKVHNEAEGRDIGPKVMKLPELAPYKVHLEVQVAP